MPRGDRTGPQGEGPMTGRQMGFCAGNDRPGFADAPGSGMGRGFFRRGRTRNFWRAREPYFQEYLPASSERTDEVQFLRKEIQQLKESLSTVLDKLKTINPEKEKQS